MAPFFLAIIHVSMARLWGQSRLDSNLTQADFLMTFMAKHISVSIERSASEVYEFASNPENLPQWAGGLSGSINNVDGEWIAEAPMGTVKVKFAESNKFGVLDHEVTLVSGIKFYNPMRILQNSDGSEVIFTLYRQAGMSDQQFADDAESVQRDLNKLKSLLEK